MVNRDVHIARIKRDALRQGYRLDERELDARIKAMEHKLELYTRVFSTDDGREVLKDLMREGGVLEGLTDCEPNRISFQAGKRYMSVYIANHSSLTLEDVISSNFPHSNK